MDLNWAHGLLDSYSLSSAVSPIFNRLGSVVGASQHQASQCDLLQSWFRSATEDVWMTLDLPQPPVVCNNQDSFQSSDPEVGGLMTTKHQARLCGFPVTDESFVGPLSAALGLQDG